MLSRVKDKKRKAYRFQVKERKEINQGVWGFTYWSRLKAASEPYRFEIMETNETMATDPLPRMYDLTDRVEDEF